MLSFRGFHRRNLRCVLPLFTLSLVTVALSLAGCGKSDPMKTDVAAATLAPGWSHIADTESGFALDAPQGWRLGVPKGFMGDLAMGDSYSSNPSPMGALGGGESVASGMPGMNEGDLTAMGAAMQVEEAKIEKMALAKLREQGVPINITDDSKATIGESPTRFYVQVLKDAGGLEGGKAAVKEEMSNEGEGKAVDLPVGKAWMYENKGRNRIGDMERHINYVMGDGKDAVVLRFVSTNNPTIFDAFHQQVAKSFRKTKV